MKADRIKKILNEPESDVLELRMSLPPLEELASLIAAFANTRGGSILIGVNDNSSVIGVDDISKDIRQINKASDYLHPQVPFEVIKYDYENRHIIEIKVEKGISPPYFANDIVYQRVGSRNITISSPQLPDIEGSAYQAVLGGSGAIAQGSGAVAAGRGGVAIGGTVSGAIAGRDVSRVITYDSAFERVAGSTAFVLDQLEISYKQTREQSQGWYRFSAIAAFIGFLLIATGVVSAFIGQTTAGLITSIAGLIPETAAALFFQQGKQANSRVDIIQEKLGQARELLTALEIANTITEEKSRNEMKKSIVLKALGLEDAKEEQN